MHTEDATWAKPVIAFLLENMPGDATVGWDHRYITAYQMGCEALAAFGIAEEKDWGAAARTTPTKPHVLPRWDDVVAVVLSLANQNALISYAGEDIEPIFGDDPVRSKTIGAAHGVVEARATPEALDILRRLGLIEGGSWAASAETAHWRRSPHSLSQTFAEDERFIAAVEAATLTMPDDVATELDRLLTVTDEDISEWRRMSARHAAELVASHGPNVILGPPPGSDDDVRATLNRVRIHDLDWLFYERWRLGDGWLTPEESDRALDVFNDSLAMKMRASVVTLHRHKQAARVDDPALRNQPRL